MSIPAATPNAASYYRWSEIPSEQVNPDLTRRLMTGDRVMVASIELKRGCVVPQHAHAHEQVSYVLGGWLRLTVGDVGSEVYDLRAGDVVVLPSNVPHGAQALEDTRVLDVFSPPREDWINRTDAYLRR